MSGILDFRRQSDGLDPSHFAELKDLPEAGEEELALMTKMVAMMTTGLDLTVFHDSYKERSRGPRRPEL